jgi:alkylhydroperoxidase family enzyme
MPRISELPRAEAPPDVQAMYDRVFGQGRDPAAEPGTSTGTPGNWWSIWSRAPDVMKFFSAYSYAQAPLEAPIRSMALMRTGYVCESQFVFSQHTKGARVSGVPEEKIEAIPYWQISELFTPKERAALAYTDALAAQQGRVHDKIFAAVVEHFGVEQTLLLTYFVNMYVLHATTCRSLKLEYDDLPERLVEIPAPPSPGVQPWRTERNRA